MVKMSTFCNLLVLIWSLFCCYEAVNCLLLTCKTFMVHNYSPNAIIAMNRGLALQCSYISFLSFQDTDQVQKAQFTDNEVQDLLTRITGLDLNKVFRPVKQELKPPKYKLLTDAQLKEVRLTLLLFLCDLFRLFSPSICTASLVGCVH